LNNQEVLRKVGLLEFLISLKELLHLGVQLVKDEFILRQDEVLKVVRALLGRHGVVERILKILSLVSFFIEV
jgi:hypothetical protein